MPDATELVKRIDGMFSSTDHVNYETLSRDTVTLFMPRRSNIKEQKPPGAAGWYDHIYEPAPIDIALKLAQGTWDILFSGNWFKTVPEGHEINEEDENHPIQAATAKIGKRMLKRLEESNFDLETQEFLGDRSTSHTAVIMCEEDDEGFYFTNIVPGEFAIDEDHRKRVVVLARKFELKAWQIMDQFQRETDTISEKIRTAASSESTKNDKFTVMHLIAFNKDGDELSHNPKDWPWSSKYACKDDNTMIRDSGYHEKPFFVSRFNRWGTSPYGTGPAHVRLGSARGLQTAKRAELALSDRIARPGLFVSEDHEGEINSLGITYVSREDAAVGLPREWKVEPRSLTELVESMNREIKSIEESFHIPLFQLLLSDMDREKTAFEVSKMLEEQIGNAAPTFSRLDQEVIKDLLTRVFNIMLRRGEFNDLLDEIGIQDPDDPDIIDLPDPKIVFTNKLAAAKKIVQTNALVTFYNVMAPFFEANPALLQNANLDKTMRRVWVDTGNPIEELEAIEEVFDLRQAQQQLQGAAAAVEVGKGASEIEKNLGAA